MPTLLRAIALLLLLDACSQEPYALDDQSIAALHGALPDSDPGLLDQLNEPGHAMEGEDHDEPSALDADLVPIAPQLEAVIGDAEQTSPSDAEGVSQGLLFSASALSLVSSTTASPQRTTVQLQVTWQTGERTVCSGTLIRPNAVLTAAHCLYNSARNGFASSISAAPGKQGTNEPYERIWAKKSFAPSQYRSLDPGAGKYPYDYGVVRLHSSFSIAARSLAEGSSALGRSFVVRGYPSKSGTSYDGRHMYESRDRIRSVLSNGVFYHRASTLGGMSGAGIDDGSRVVGVHTGGADTNNSGVVLSTTSLTLVRDWATRAL